MSSFVRKLDEAFTLMDKIGSAAVRGIISHEDKEKILQLVKEDLADIITEELNRRYPPEPTITQRKVEQEKPKPEESKSADTKVLHKKKR